jgi:hypothetical protein
MAQQKVIQELDVWKVRLSKGLISGSTWEDVLNVSSQAVGKIRRFETHKDVVDVEQLSQDDQGRLWLFVKRLCKLMVCRAAIQSKKDDFIQQMERLVLSDKELPAQIEPFQITGDIEPVIDEQPQSELDEGTDTDTKAPKPDAGIDFEHEFNKANPQKVLKAQQNYAAPPPFDLIPQEEK